MRPGREVDARIAKEVFGYKVWSQAKVLYENAPKGDRPLRNYSKEIEWAFEVANHMRITLLPIVGGDWFAFVGPAEKFGWESPQAMLQFLEAGKFGDCGAAAGTDIAAVICEAALKAVEKRKSLSDTADQPVQGMASDLTGEPMQREGVSVTDSQVAENPTDAEAQKPTGNVVSIH